MLILLYKGTKDMISSEVYCLPAAPVPGPGPVPGISSPVVTSNEEMEKVIMVSTKL